MELQNGTVAEAQVVAPEGREVIWEHDEHVDCGIMANPFMEAAEEFDQMVSDAAYDSMKHEHQMLRMDLELRGDLG